MQKKVLLIMLCLVLTGATMVYGQDPKHKIFYKDVPEIQKDEYSIQISDAVSEKVFTKMKLNITNKTPDYLIYKPAEAVFHYEHGNYSPTKKMDIISPMERDSKVIEVSGGDKFHVDKLSVDLNFFYRLPSTGTPQSADDFNLPASVNDFNAGNFKCTLQKLNKTTKETTAVFNCTYMGKDYGIVDPGKLSVKLEDGKEFANDKKSKPKVLEPGEDIKITAAFFVPAKVADMQFANMKIVWKNTFIESKAVKISGSTFNLEIDPGKTEGKNK